MRKGLTIILSVIFITNLNAKVLTVEKTAPVSNIYTKIIDESQVTEQHALPKILRNHSSYRQAQNPNITTTLLDSSVHGYGMVVPHTSPVSFVASKGINIGYRGWVLEPFTDEQGNTSSANNSGFIKAALSTDGANFSVFSGLNDEIMGPNTQVIDGPLMGRYPSAVANDDYPYVVWTEATLYTGSATNNGGRPMYTYDEFGWFAGSYFQPTIDINYGWYNGSDPLDAAGDLWVNSPVLVDDGTYEAMVITATQWSASPDANFPEKSAYFMRSTINFSGNYQFYSLPEMMFNQDDLGGIANTGTTSSASVDINSSGVGYAMCTAYLTDSTLSERHNFIIRKTSDFGISWSSDGIGGTDYYFLPDTTMERVFVESGYLPDSVIFYSVNDTTGDTTFTPTDLPGVFPLYDHEVHVDESGTLHIFTTMVVESDQAGYIYVALGGVGLYHLWSDDPTNPGSWQAAPIAELSSTFGESGMPDGNGGGNYFNVFGTGAISNHNDDVMWVAYHALGDTSQLGFNWDIFLSKSVDGGATWSEPENITNTGGLQEDEMYVHMSPTATDTNCFMIYTQPVYTTNHLSDPANMAAFQQNIYFVMYGEPFELEIGNEVPLPGKFSLEQNYPNPFNPTTHIAYGISKTGNVELALYNTLGQRVQTLINEVQGPGEYTFELNANDFASGIYFYKMTQHDQTLTRKLVLMK
ncbi:MAG: T9SS type A sorting domain-containing protein [Candidatus Marinimicrobia bacterium]|jgi:hypothetical protein|nr:T9SS type A sorting domain-containing protein [Candidatus Neomarinimicrobiota bacterium]